MNSELRFSVVVPCYNSENSLDELWRALVDTLDELADDFEVIFVNDGSRDLTWEKLKAIADVDRRARPVNLSRNFGQQRAVLAGFELCRYEYIVTLDDDLQHDPAEIKKLYDHLLRSKADLVIGAIREKAHGYIRDLGTAFVQRLSSYILGVPRNFKFSSFRVMKVRVAKDALKFQVANPVIGFLLIKTTNRIQNCEISHHSRKYGESNYNARALVKYCLTMMIDYSVLPLKLVGYTGTIIAMISFLLGLYYALTWLLGGITVSGFTTLVLVICFFFGLLFISIGVIGSYLIRVLQNSNQHPMYLLEEIYASAITDDNQSTE